MLETPPVLRLICASMKRDTVPTPTIKIYLDGADRPTLLEMASNPLVQGFTTNPSLIRKAGVTDYPGYCKALLPDLQGKPVSFEVFADDFPEMKRQGLEIASWEKYLERYVICG